MANPRKLVMMCDEFGLPRAYGAAPDALRARRVAHEQLAKYIEKKRALGEVLSAADFHEEVKDCE